MTARAIAAAAAGGLATLVLWETAARAFAGLAMIAGPVEVAGWLSSHAGLVVRATAITLQNAALGFVAGNLVAVALAALCLAVPRVERLVGVLALLVFCLPLVATGPILRALWGTGAGPQVTLAALAVYYTTFLALMVGLRAAPAAWFDLVRSYGGGRLDELWRIRAAAALPYLVAGLQIATPAAVLGAMVGEFTGAERGLGVLTIRAMREIDVAGLWAVAAVAAGLSVAAYAAVGAAGARLAVAPPALLMAPPPAHAAASGAARALRGMLGLAIAAVAAVALWHAAMELAGLHPFFAKRPADVWAWLVTAPGAAAHRATLAAAWAQTMVLTVPGYLAGLALGAGLALAIAARPGVGAVAMPLAIALRAVPILTTAPLIVLALGRGAVGTIAIVATMIFFPTLVACLSGLSRVPPPLRDLLASYAARPLHRLWLVQVPAMLPAFFAAARMALPAAILAATTAEWLATGIGMGGLMALTPSTSGWTQMWAAVAVMALTAAVGYAAVGRVERRVLLRFAPEQLHR
ncbi:MAG: ABC transporter permease subunit [Paracoccaceae bacterium]|nr:MAG: ABC transporter permease subunit [Paracoccaceae bacterium]